MEAVLMRKSRFYNGTPEGNCVEAFAVPLDIGTVRYQSSFVKSGFAAFLFDTAKP